MDESVFQELLLTENGNDPIQSFILAGAEGSGTSALYSSASGGPRADGGGPQPLHRKAGGGGNEGGRGPGQAVLCENSHG